MPTPTLADLDRETLLRVAHEYMMLGHLIDRALMPQLLIRVGREAMEPVAIEEWMGASPVYTPRMRTLMGIEGDDVASIVKSLQLDVGFVHQYMDVAYEVLDAHRGEFWLNHCGALLDAEPGGDEFVVMMCHHIEDPTFDATACATNPRARIRPLHRPPRVPADRAPHCHWSITIEPDADPIPEPAVAAAVRALPLAALPVAAVAAVTGTDGDGLADYAGPVDPSFRLAHLSTAALRAVLDEFRMQSHLIVSAAELAIASRYGAAAARDVMSAQWSGAAWIAAERLRAALGGGPGAEATAAALALNPCLPPGFEVEVEHRESRGIDVRLTPVDAALADADNPGWVGLAARGEPGGIESMARALDPGARVRDVATSPTELVWHISLDADAEPAPTAVDLVRISTAAGFAFT